jgi:hypothetical protein
MVSIGRLVRGCTFLLQDCPAGAAREAEEKFPLSFQLVGLIGSGLVKPTARARPYLDQLHAHLVARRIERLAATRLTR